MSDLISQCQDCKYWKRHDEYWGECKSRDLDDMIRPISGIQDIWEFYCEYGCNQFKEKS